VSVVNQEGRRTAFKAAYLMGERGRELFVWLAGKKMPAARSDAALSLYLRWRRDREFVFGLLDALAEQVAQPPFGRRGRVLRFMGDLSITIYVNHPEDEDVIARTTKLWHRVLRDRLRLHQLLFVFRAGIFDHVKALIAMRTLHMLNLEELDDPKLVFRQQPNDRKRFLRMVPLVDPATNIDSNDEHEDLRALLESAILPHRILAALIIAIHAVDAPATTADLLGDLRPRLTSQGLLWATLAYTVPLPGTPEGWVPQLESMTTELADRHRATFMAEEGGILERFDIALLPLGLAYGKRGGGMPVFKDMLDRRSKDPALAARVIRGLAPVGVYFPHPVFDLLRECADALNERSTADARIVDALVGALAAMRALHFDAVDLFLQDIRAPDAIRDRVSRQESSEVVSRCVHWLGFYNNAVHESLKYPIMRDVLVVGALEALGNAHRASDFTRAYTPKVLRLLEETDFELIRWMQQYALS
jgi:hypothetical protein